MPPRKATGSGGVSSLDKRLQNPNDNSWSIQAMKQNLQEDSAILEATLREANKLLAESGAPPLIDVGGIPNKERLKRAKDQSGTIDEDCEDDDDDEDGSKAFVPNGVFLIKMDVSGLGVDPRVVGFTTTMSEECSARINALEQVIGKEGVSIIRKSVQSDMDAVCRMSRNLGGGGSKEGAVDGLIEELESRIVEEEALKMQAHDQVKGLQEQLRSQSVRIVELQDRIEFMDSSSSEGSEIRRKLEKDVEEMREELQVAVSKMRAEEGDKLKTMERMRKKEAEWGKMKETMDKMTMQLKVLGEERDNMHHALEDTRSRCHDLQSRLHSTQEELGRLQSAERVMKRNLQLQMPDEIKRVVRRVEELERINRDLQTKLGSASGKGGPEDPAKKAERLASELSELRIVHRALEERHERLQKEQDAEKKRWESSYRLSENRGRALFDKTIMYTQKLQGASDVRVQERLHSRSSGNELTALRRKNMDLLRQLNELEEQKMDAARREEETDARCRVLQEKLDLFATIQRMDISKMQYSADARTEDDVDQIFAHRSGLVPRGVWSRGATPIAGTRLMRSRAGSIMSESSLRDIRGESAQHRAQTAAAQVSEARKDVDSMEVEALKHKLQQMQAKAHSEEKARSTAQERVVSMAEQLLDKEKEIANLQELLRSGDMQKRKKKPQRESFSYGNSHTMQNKMRDIEQEMHKVESKLSEKEEECRIKARKIAELLFKLQVEEDSNHRIHDQLIEVREQQKKKDELIAKELAHKLRGGDSDDDGVRLGGAEKKVRGDDLSVAKSPVLSYSNEVSMEASKSPMDSPSRGTTSEAKRPLPTPLEADGK